MQGLGPPFITLTHSVTLEVGGGDKVQVGINFMPDFA